VASLQAELSRVKSLLSSKESELAKMHKLLAQKDDQLSAIRADFEAQSVKLSEAGSVMSQITSLSQALVDAAGGVGASLDESSVLAQTNYELFSANRALLERELELQKMQVRLVCCLALAKQGPVG
jgi:chromosome segregation ATPase